MKITNWQKIFFLIVFFVLLFYTNNTEAADSRCWTQSACIAARNTSGVPTEEEAVNGFISAESNKDIESICQKKTMIINNNVEKIGFCLAAGEAETQISFGGKNKFSNFGDFIKYLYRYGVIIAAILSMLMMIFGGVQWIVSGANKNGKSGAIKKITGSVIGLFLAVSSYIVLNAVNPNLVNIRLPEIWMINTNALSDEYCDFLSDIHQLAFAYPSGVAVTEAEKTAGLQNAVYNYTRNTAKCGNDYFVNGSNGMTCKGTSCTEEYGENHLCFKGINDDKDSCKPGNIGGIIYNSGLVDGMVTGVDSWIFSGVADIVTEFWAWPWTNEVNVFSVCNNGENDFGFAKSAEGFSIEQPDFDRNMNEIKHTQQYTLQFDGQKLDILLISAENRCKDNDGLKGFVLKIDLNTSGSLTDQTHFLGAIGNNAVDLAVDYGGLLSDIDDELLRKADKKYFITGEQLKKGLKLNVDAKRICIAPFMTQSDGADIVKNFIKDLNRCYK